jgi:hypothetical protein
MTREEQAYHIYISARRVVKMAEGSIKTTTALECLKLAELQRISNNLESCSNILKELNEYANDGMDYRLQMIATRIDETEKTLFDTLGSHKTGVALDALAILPDRIHRDREEDD